ncbi:restriction endonuclease subunit S [Acinetobacter baumannii]|uniref:restriction endonuclease subunit S n=1 Tax=Acinetobacter baumannii TaxID=470 RepID=UPI003A86E583
MTAPKLRFKEFDDSWDLKKLDQIAEVNPKTKELPASFFYIDLESVSEGLLIQRKKIDINEAPSRAQRLLEKSDVLFQMVRPYQQNNFYFDLDGDYVASTGYAQIRTKLNSKYIYYVLHSKKFLDEVINRCTGTSYPAINSSELSSIEVAFPSIREQTKIASFLSAVDEKISQLTQKHALLSQYKQGMMQKLFSQQIRFKADDGSEFGEWDINIIRDVFTNKSKNFNPQNEGNLPCIELEHLSQNTGKILGTIESCEQQSTKNLFEKNSVLFGKLRPYLRKFAKPKFKGVCSSEIWVLTGIKVSNDYLFQYIQSEQFSELTNIQSGSKMPRADWGVISEAEIEYPCLAEQTKISNFLSAIDQKIEVVAQQIEQAKQWKKGLLQQLFV